MTGTFIRRSNSYRVQEISRCDRCQKSSLVFDMYRKPFRLLLPDEKPQYRTLVGAVLTIFTLIITLSYTSWKLLVMFEQTEFKIQAHDQENYYDFEEEFGTNEGFALAAAITSYDGSSEDITDYSIGRFIFVKKEWDGSDKTKKDKIDFKILETEPCNLDLA